MALNARSKRTAAENKYMDELLSQLLSLQKDETEAKQLQMLDTVLDFINRQSQFLAAPKTSKRVIDLVHAYIDAAKKKEIDARVDALTSEPPTLVSMAEDSDSKAISTSAKKVKAKGKAVKKKKKAAAVTPAVPSEEEEKKKEEREGSDAEEEDSGPKLIGNGGSTDVYTWTQTLRDVEIQYKVALGLKGRDFTVDFSKDELKVAIKGGGGSVLTDGQLFGAVKPMDCSWTLTTERDERLLTVFLVKENQMEWWNCVVKGDPEIDTKKIEPENSKLDDLDDDTRQTVEKMMFDQRQKMRGLPTSKDREQADMLAKLQSKFPDMDFSKAKFSGAGGSMF